MNTDNFLIEERDLELAQDICRLIPEEGIRNRAVANAVAANIAEKFFDKETYKVDSISGLHNIGAVLEDIDISDIYINNSYIDVRIYFNEDTLCIPKAHFDNNLTPSAYMFVKANPELSGATVTGFILPENVDKTSLNGDYYVVEENSLVSFYDIETNLIYTEDNYAVDDEEIYAYIEGRIEDKSLFYRKLTASESARLKLAKVIKAQYIFNFVSIPEDADFQENAEETSLDFQLADNFEIVANENAAEELDSDDDFASLLDDADAAEIIEDSDELNTDEQEALKFDDLGENNNQEELKEEVSNSIDEPENSFEYKTVTSPSLDSSEVDTYEALLNEDNNIETVNDELKGNQSPDKNAVNQPAAEESINTLFEDSSASEEAGEEEFYTPPKKQGSSFKILLLIALLAVLGGVGYFGYTKFTASSEDDTQTNLISDSVQEDNVKEQESANPKTQDAMPIETVEASAPNDAHEEAASVSIPAIEQNLDASILVSNLKVDWEVPAGYASNTSAKRYLVKLGKIIQLNLKTELLLLSKPPITNKIAVEIKYNPGSKKFETSGVTISSGEKSVDDLIMQTVNKALSMNLNMNTNSFSKLQGNPVLVIHL